MARIVVVGPGAIGSAAAAALASTGRHDVSIAARSALDELIVEHPAGVERHRLDVFTDPADVADHADLIVLATKAHQTDGARPWLDALASETSVVAVLQNGIEHRERFEPLIGSALLAPAIVFCPSERRAPGHVVVSGRARLVVPADRAGAVVVDAFAASFVDVTASDDWLTDAWIKLLSNCAGGAITTLARSSNSVLSEDDGAALFRAVVEEAATVGRADGARLPDDIAERVLRGLMAAAGDHHSSIVLDRIEGRPTEWQVRNEVVVRKGAAHGIDVPLNQAMTTLLRLGEPPASGEIDVAGGHTVS